MVSAGPVTKRKSLYRTLLPKRPGLPMEELIEKRIPWVVYAPSRRTSQLALEVVNKPGVMARIAKLMGDLGVNILSGIIWAEPGEEKASWVFFVDLTDASIGADELAEKLRELDVVLRADVVEHRIGDLAVDTCSFPVMLLARRMVLLDVAGLAAMLDWLDRTFETGGHAILFDMGLEAGKSIARGLERRFGLFGRQAFETFLAMCTAMGFFTYELVGFDAESRQAIVHLFHSFECEPFRERGERRTRSHLLRGMVAGALETVFGCPMMVRETRCVARGDGYCEFVAEPRA